MHQSPDPEERTTYGRVTWYGIAVSYAMAAAIPLLLWAASAPLTAAVVFAAASVVAVGTRRAHRLARCVRNCKGLAFDLPGTVRVTVAWTPTCDAC
ncbi:hypothetical protein [Halobacterium wangiae]|uniref:hypothetical protein n=1 Tax=Halobacterium wangiae TaxID=2902623 RepID=UPI001E35FC32|nr:hypothetical protein [Halobacterium wangiae]